MSESKGYYRRDLFSPPHNKVIKDLTETCSNLFDPLEVNFPNTFLFGLDSIEVLNIEKEWIVRDGLLFLNEFFFKHPNPLNFKSRIYIHETLVKIVPTSWREFVGSYSFSYNSKNVKDELFVMFYQGIPTAKTLKNEMRRVRLCSELVSFQQDFFNNTYHLTDIINSLQVPNVQVEAAHWDFRTQNFLNPHYFWESIDNFLTAFSWAKFKMIQMSMVEFGHQSQKGSDKRIRMSDNCELGLQDLISWEDRMDSSDYRKYISSLYHDKQHSLLKISTNEMRTMWGCWKDMNEG